MSSDISKSEEAAFSDITIEFGRVLAKMRKENDLTQHDLANGSGISLRMISDMERGIRQPSLITLFKLAKGLKTSPNFLIERLLKELDLD